MHDLFVVCSGGIRTLRAVEQFDFIGRYVVREEATKSVESQGAAAAMHTRPRTRGSLPASVMIAPPQECPTSNTGPACILIVCRTASTSPGYIEKHGMPNTPLDLANGWHRCIQFRFPHSGKIADWDFVIDGSWQSVPVKSRMIVNDAPSVLAACLSGHGIAQPLELYSREALRSKRLIRVLPAWNQERYPLYAYLPSRRHPPAKVRLILSFIEQLVGSDASDT